jgi:7-carboxy-7-deazaguanine synthase
MKIAELFYSIQGEGELTGIPSVFVRTSGCNLRCRWCDTKYAWDSEGDEIGVPELLKRVDAFPTRFCVLTGGEPMMAEEIRDLAEQLVTAGKHVTIETAGTVLPESIACSLASLSPKLTNSTPGGDWRDRHESLRLQLDVVREWVDGYDYQLKFVVSEDGDVQEVLDLLNQLERDVPSEKVLLMPEGRETEVIQRKSDVIVEACKEHGFRFCNRLHVQLWNNERGR